MITILIKLSSIKLNPTHTINNSFYVNGPSETTFTYKGKLLDWLLEEIKNMLNVNNTRNNPDFNIMEVTSLLHFDLDQDIECSGYIFNPHKIPEKFLVEGFHIKTDHKRIQVPSHFNSPKYLYEYTKVKLKCSECKVLSLVDDIDDYYDEDGCSYKKCSNCNSLDSFVDYKYETIENALKRKNNK